MTQTSDTQAKTLEQDWNSGLGQEKWLDPIRGGYGQRLKEMQETYRVI